MKKSTWFIIAILAVSGGFVGSLIQNRLFGPKASTTISVASEREDLLKAVNTGGEDLPKFETASAVSTPTVVFIKTVSTVRYESPFGFWDFDPFGSRGKASSSGSGVIVSSDGYIVTNNHVIQGAEKITVVLNKGKREFEAAVVGADPSTDLALIKIDKSELPAIVFGNSDKVNVGEWVLAVGNPFNLNSTVTAGIVSAKGRDLQGNYSTDSFIQTDAAVNPGNSGGALVNSRGELVGINTAISTKTGSYIGYSFAVPSNIAKKIIDDILEFGKVQEAISGFLPDLREDDIEGVRIGDFSEGSNAEKAGLLKGDIIVKINDIKISKFSELTGQLSAKRPGDSVKLTIDRDGEIFTKNINLIKRIERYISRTYGIEFIDDPKGAKIIRDGLSEDSPSSITGYIITTITGKEVESASEAVKLLDSLSRNGYRLKVEMIDLDNETSIYFF